MSQKTGDAPIWCAQSAPPSPPDWNRVNLETVFQNLRLTKIRPTTISSRFFANHLYIVYKTEVQTVTLRCRSNGSSCDQTGSCNWFFGRKHTHPTFQFSGCTHIARHVRFAKIQIVFSKETCKICLFCPKTFKIVISRGSPEKKASRPHTHFKSHFACTLHTFECGRMWACANLFS